MLSAMRDRRNILISGGTGSGKTTLLNGLAAWIAPEHRLVVIEDTAELHIAQPNHVRFEARREEGEKPLHAVADLTPPVESSPPRVRVRGNSRSARTESPSVANSGNRSGR
jgi:energy-coupling factor transporter ATP-binding protein EcfA2